MASEFRRIRRVEFAETDAAGVVHFSQYFRYMEEAEHAFYRSLGQEAFRQEGSRITGLVRAEARCRYLRPLAYGDEFETHLRVLEKSSRSFRLAFSLAKLGGDGRQPVAEGEMLVVFASLGPEEARPRALDLPPELFRAVSTADIPRSFP